MQLHSNVQFRCVCFDSAWKYKPVHKVTTFHMESSWNLPMQIVLDIFSPRFDIFTAAHIQQGGMVFHLRSSRHSKKKLLKNSTVTSLSRKHVSVTPDTLQTRLSSFYWNFLLLENMNYLYWGLLSSYTMCLWITVFCDPLSVILQTPLTSLCSPLL